MLTSVKMSACNFCVTLSGKGNILKFGLSAYYVLILLSLRYTGCEWLINSKSTFMTSELKNINEENLHD